VSLDDIFPYTGIITVSGASPGSWTAIADDVIALQEFVYEPHGEKSDKFMKTEKEHILSGWKAVKRESKEVRY
jgi:hypothetical protein